MNKVECLERFNLEKALQLMKEGIETSIIEHIIYKVKLLIIGK